jgi:hypothetical protein
MMGILTVQPVYSLILFIFYGFLGAGKLKIYNNRNLMKRKTLMEEIKILNMKKTGQNLTF